MATLPPKEQRKVSKCTSSHYLLASLGIGLDALCYRVFKSLHHLQYVDQSCALPRLCIPDVPACCLQEPDSLIVG
jgi:hypothetical protein